MLDLEPLKLYRKLYKVTVLHLLTLLLVTYFKKEVMQQFFKLINQMLQKYKPDIILSKLTKSQEPNEISINSFNTFHINVLYPFRKLI
jgi:hypothetical protein